MASFEDEEYVQATIALTPKAGGADLEINLINRPIDNPTYYPLLKELTGIGAKMSGWMPTKISGSLVIDDSPSSFGYERRFSDLLERYTLTDNTVTIKWAKVAAGESPTSSWTQTFKGKLGPWRKSKNEIRLDVISDPIEQRYITTTIDSGRFSNAPTASLGQVVPMVFGQDVTVPAIPVDYETANQAIYIYASAFGSNYVPDGAQNYYVKDRDGLYREIESAAGISTALYSNGYTTPFPNPYGPFFSDIAHQITPSTPCVITSGRMYFEGENDVTWAAGNGILTFSIYAEDPIIGGPGELLASVDRTKLAFQSSFRGASDFYINFVFPKPVILAKDAYYYISWAQTFSATEDDATLNYQGTVGPQYVVQKDYQGVWTQYNTGDPVFDLYGLVFTDSNTPSAGEIDNQGIGTADFYITQRDVSGVEDCPLRDLVFAVNINGIEDNGSGDITGSSNAVIERPDHILKLLGESWNGTNWTANTNQFDTTNFSTQHSAVFSSSSNQFYRAVAGATVGRTTAKQVIAEVAKDAMLSVCATNRTTVGVWYGCYPHGAELTSVGTLTDENFEIEEISQQGIETIVNYAEVLYGRSIIERDLVTFLSDGTLSTYLNRYLFAEGELGEADDVCAASVDAHGTREIFDKSSNYVNTEQSARARAELLCRMFSEPQVTVRGTAKLRDVYGWKILGKCEILHSELPAYFGTSKDPDYPVFDEEIVDPWEGRYPKRAKRYEAQIIGYEDIHPEEGPFERRFTLRLITSEHEVI